MQLEIESDSRWAEILVGNLTTYQLSDLVRTALRDLEIRHSNGDRKKRDPAAARRYHRALAALKGSEPIPPIKSYLVAWECEDVQATTPENAALYCLKIMRDQSAAQAFSVRECGSDAVSIIVEPNGRARRDS